MSSELFALFFPVVMFLTMPVIDLESIPEYPLRWLSMAFYLGTPLWAAWSAYKLKYRQYRLDVVTGAPSAFFGSFFFWPYFFYHFIHNRQMILAGKAQIKTDADSAQMRWSVIVLFAWSILWLFLLAISIPSMYQSPGRTSAATAVVSLKDYCTAQVMLQHETKGAFCDNFRNLFYSEEAQWDGQGLIPQEMADAFAWPTRGVPTRGKATTERIPYYDYVFYEDPYVTTNNLWSTTFALVAYPVRSRRMRTPHALYWVGLKGDVLQWKIPEGIKEMRPLRPDESPLHPQCTLQWEEL